MYGFTLCRYLDSKEVDLVLKSRGYTILSVSKLLKELGIKPPHHDIKRSCLSTRFCYQTEIEHDFLLSQIKLWYNSRDSLDTCPVIRGGNYCGKNTYYGGRNTYYDWWELNEPLRSMLSNNAAKRVPWLN